MWLSNSGIKTVKLFIQLKIESKFSKIHKITSNQKKSQPKFITPLLITKKLQVSRV